MAFTTPFRTRNEIVPCKNLNPESHALCALDIGYSAVKGFSPTNRFCIPAYVRANDSTVIGTPMSTDIYYKDEDGIIYAVGNVALESIPAEDTNDANNTMFSRNRYFSKAFLILARVGLALGVGPDNDKPVYLQTGLPPAYKAMDTPLIVDALSGEHHFWVKVGSSDWVGYDITVSPENISVIDQPIGSVYCALKRNDGTTVLGPDNKTYIDHNTLVFDGGFGTLDIFSIMNRVINDSNTFNDLGMRAIFEKTANDIMAQYHMEIHAHTLQNYLADGCITVFDRRSHASRKQDIAPILKASTKAICKMALNRLDTAYDDLMHYDFLLVTGGTGAAWFDMIQDHYKNFETLQVVAANQNDKIPPVYNNVRGYYIYRALNLQRG